MSFFSFSFPSFSPFFPSFPLAPLDRIGNWAVTHCSCCCPHQSMCKTVKLQHHLFIFLATWTVVIWISIGHLLHFLVNCIVIVEVILLSVRSKCCLRCRPLTFDVYSINVVPCWDLLVNEMVSNEIESSGRSRSMLCLHSEEWIPMNQPTSISPMRASKIFQHVLSACFWFMRSTVLKIVQWITCRSICLHSIDFWIYPRSIVSWKF